MLRNFPSSDNPCRAVCPTCGGRGTLHLHGRYRRWFQKGPESAMELVEVRRMRCSSCGHTHAALPEGAVPYSAIGVEAAFAICAAKEGGQSAGAICRAFAISVRTLYRTLSRFARLVACTAGAVSASSAVADPARACVLALGATRRMPFECVRLIRRAGPGAGAIAPLHTGCASTARVRAG